MSQPPAHRFRREAFAVPSRVLEHAVLGDFISWRAPFDPHRPDLVGAALAVPTSPAAPGARRFGTG